MNRIQLRMYGTYIIGLTLFVLYSVSEDPLYLIVLFILALILFLSNIPAMKETLNEFKKIREENKSKKKTSS